MSIMRPGESQYLSLQQLLSKLCKMQGQIVLGRWTRCLQILAQH